MQRSCAAESHQAEITRIDAFLHGARADGISHIGVDDGQYTGCGFFGAKTQFSGESLDNVARRLGIEMHWSAQKIIRIQPA